MQRPPQRLVGNRSGAIASIPGPPSSSTPEGYHPKCASVSYQNDQRSREEQLFPELTKLANSRSVAQVDKPGRYFSLCQNIVQMAYRRGYSSVFKEIYVNPLPAHQSLAPPGASKACYVDVEIQITLYLEEHPPNRPPRVMRCSKCACFLCGLFSQSQDSLK